MPRHMSFIMTTEAVRRREKTVTRRLGWWNLEPGTLLWAVEKGMGLKKGEKVKKLALIRVVSVQNEWLLDMHKHGPDECAREGFPEMTPPMFCAMFSDHNKIDQGYCYVNRIEFEYVDGQP